MASSCPICTRSSSIKHYICYKSIPLPILFGEASLWHARHEYVEHYHHERNHQGKGNIILFPSSRHAQGREGRLRCWERLGGLLKYYDREAA
jgi:hypothetical protein